jgi:polysaccharide export outer membrane protein
MSVFYKSGFFDLDCSNLCRARSNIGNATWVFLKSFLLLSVLFSVGVSAQAISPQMMQQLQSMPRAEQEALAKQYGIDLDQVLGGQGAKGAKRANADIAMAGEPLEQRSLLDTDLESQQNYQLFQEKFAEFEKSIIEEKEEAKRYGVSLFDKDISTFAPTDDVIVPDDYRLGAGDQLAIQLFGAKNDQFDLQVTRNGQVSFPKLGPIALAGLTYEDAKALIESLVAAQFLGTKAIVSVGRLRAINIFMAGEVVIPGAYSVSALTTITQALFRAGGIGDIGALRNVQVKRNGVTAETFDVYQLLLKGDASGDLRLRSGDVVFVPPYAGVVTVDGAVKRPMIYEFVDGESVADAVAMAGGLNQDAYAYAIGLVSKAVGKSLPRAQNIDLTDPKRANIGLRNGDKIRVPESTDNLDNAVTLAGAVVRPGIYGWVAGQRISDIISSIPSDLKPYADLGYSLVVRQKNAQLDIEVLQINLEKALNNLDSQDNILTQARDKIIVFGVPSVREVSALDMANEKLEKLAARLKKIQTENIDDSGSYSAGTNRLTTDDEILRGSGSKTADSIENEAELKAVERLTLLKPVLEKLKGQARSGESLEVVSISGAVKLPGNYPLSSKHTVANLVAAAGGLKDSAYLDAAELRSLYMGPNKDVLSRYRNLNLIVELGSLSGTKLQSRDHLNVKELPDWNPTNAVILEGEVRFPGTYRIGKGESLSDVIKRAGGLTQSSFPDGAIFTRESIVELEANRSKQFAQSILHDFATSQLTKEDSNINVDEIQEIAEILENFEGAGRLLVDIEAAMSGDSLANIVLENGDILRIPELTSTVTVVGEIRRPGTHTLQAGLDLYDYLGLSGGLTARAEKKELYVVRADGSVLRPTTSLLRFTGGNDSIRPGDTIVVPIDAGYTDNLTLWREVTQVIFNTTSGLASIILVTR